uniref:Osteopetrosis-associated transmembrane protein 1 n=1 Tax=Anopheles epiroticus TaxID=199890 RepID=A0A182PL27_9DIPT
MPQMIACCFWTATGDQECEDIHLFLKYGGKMMVALPMHTYPVFNVCTSQLVINDYHMAIEHYQNMTKSPICQKYLTSNRMNVYETIYNLLTGMWNDANCDACANAVNETATFMNMSSVLERCIAINSADPCEKCADDYQRVQQYYAKLDKEGHGPDRLCFDIADRMNKTRRSWSGTYNCCHDKRHSMVIFSVIASVVCTLPVLFYAVMHLVTVRQEARRISLLSASSGHEDRPQHFSSSRPYHGVLRQPEMERIVETLDGDEDEGAESQESDNESDEGVGGVKKLALLSPDPTEINNLDVKESKLINVSGLDHQMPSQSATCITKVNQPQNCSHDESLLH